MCILGRGGRGFIKSNWWHITVDKSLKGKTQCLSVSVCLVSKKRHIQALHHDNYNKLSWDTAVHEQLWAWTLMRKLMYASSHSFLAARHLVHSDIQVAWWAFEPRKYIWGCSISSQGYAIFNGHILTLSGAFIHFQAQTDSVIFIIFFTSVDIVR